jgi:hypothetical protein
MWANNRKEAVMSWVKYLVYILSFFFPPVGIITLWVLAGRGEEELTEIAKWSFLSAFIGIIVWIIVSVCVGVNYRIPWSGMWRW